MPSRIEDLLRELAPQVLGVLARRYGQFDAAEDAVQEALLAAAVQWPADGIPDHPRSWLITVAGRRLVDDFRSESARRAREETAAVREPAEPAPVAGRTEDGDPVRGRMSGCAPPPCRRRPAHWQHALLRSPHVVGARSRRQPTRPDRAE